MAAHLALACGELCCTLETCSQVAANESLRVSECRAGRELMSVEGFEHTPVLVDDILSLIAVRPGQIFLDGTVGLGGHAAAIAPRLQPGGTYIGIDIDAAMLVEARRRLAAIDSVGQVRLFEASYADFPEVLAQAGTQRVDHALLDLGVNSAQLADAARGFSFERDGPLDMRFSSEQREQAIDLVNRLGENELADLFYQFGQEEHSRKIARKICQVRHLSRISTTRALAKAIESAIAALGGPMHGRIHPATRCFQALRVAVNHELENLEQFLARIADSLNPGGTVSIISFHSLEDGIVKRWLRGTGRERGFKELTKRPVIAGTAEREANPRSRSAKLRVARLTSDEVAGGIE